MSKLIDKTLANLNSREDFRLKRNKSGEMSPECSRACAMIGVINDLLGRDSNGVGPLAVTVEDGEIVGYQKSTHYKKGRRDPVRIALKNLRSALNEPHIPKHPALLRALKALEAADV